MDFPILVFYPTKLNLMYQIQEEPDEPYTLADKKPMKDWTTILEDEINKTMKSNWKLAQMVETKFKVTWKLLKKKLKLAATEKNSRKTKRITWKAPDKTAEEFFILNFF